MGRLLNVQLTKDTQQVIGQIAYYLNELDELNDPQFQVFERWQTNVQRLLLDSFNEPIVSQQFMAKTKVFYNKFSDAENVRNVEQAREQAKGYLEDLIVAIENGKYSDVSLVDDEIDLKSARIIIRRILRNFYKHLEAMYQTPVHGNGSIKKEDLDKIQLGNEYDVQRILYSIIRPVFPDARLEVVDDVGYGSVRYDIVLKKYDIIIEVKCTRQSMTERKLTEELGADGFHYKGEHLFMFIYDKVKLISNVDAFVESYTKSKQAAGKTIETVVIQEVKL